MYLIKNNKEDKKSDVFQNQEKLKKEEYMGGIIQTIPKLYFMQVKQIFTLQSGQKTTIGIGDVKIMKELILKKI